MYVSVRCKVSALSAKRKKDNQPSGQPQVVRDTHTPQKKKTHTHTHTLVLVPRKHRAARGPVLLRGLLLEELIIVKGHVRAQELLRHRQRAALQDVTLCLWVGGRLFGMLACVCGGSDTHAREPGPLLLPPKCDAYVAFEINSAHHTSKKGRTHLQFWVVLAG